MLLHFYGFSPEELYRKIGSSSQLAYKKSGGM